MQRSEANNYYPHLMASKLAVDGSTAADTDLDWIAGATLETHTPIFAIITYGSGTLGACICKIKAGSAYISAGAVTLTTLNATETKMIVSLTDNVIAFSNNPADFITLTVGTPSAGASTFNVYVYGIELN